MLADFVYLFLASAVLGLAFGLVTAYCLRAFHFHHVAQARGCRADRGRSELAQLWRQRWWAAGASGPFAASRARRQPLPLPARGPLLAQEVALIGMTAYLSYLAGDVLGFSGILALFVCAVAISHYALHNISGAGAL